jgi:hypothetical protein
VNYFRTLMEIITDRIRDWLSLRERERGKGREMER